MADSSERLAAWASEDSTRNQWDFAEDTAMTSCRSALKNVAGRAVSNPELRPIWSRLCEHYLGLFAAGGVAAAITGLVTLAGAPWAAVRAPRCARLCFCFSLHLCLLVCICLCFCSSSSSSLD